jgi:hypothetical protein
VKSKARPNDMLIEMRRSSVFDLADEPSGWGEGPRVSTNIRRKSFGCNCVQTWMQAREQSRFNDR